MVNDRMVNDRSVLFINLYKCNFYTDSSIAGNYYLVVAIDI